MYIACTCLTFTIYWTDYYDLYKGLWKIKNLFLDTLVIGDLIKNDLLAYSKAFYQKSLSKYKRLRNIIISKGLKEEMMHINH